MSSIPIADTYTHKDNRMIWNSPDCFEGKDSSGNFICTNMNYYPLHIDLAIQSVHDEILNKIGVQKDNPKIRVTAKTCPREVTDVLHTHCGPKSNSNPGAEAPQTLHQYCPNCTAKDLSWMKDVTQDKCNKD